MFPPPLDLHWILGEITMTLTLKRRGKKLKTTDSPGLESNPKAPGNCKTVTRALKGP